MTQQMLIWDSLSGCPVRVTNRPGHQALGINGRDDGVVVSACFYIVILFI